MLPIKMGGKAIFLSHGCENGVYGLNFPIKLKMPVKEVR
ncbi:hypothetical protein Enr17x_09860 [Gimesia fumaroli]|jgi:hypothetical protein|uniref:Uncharacterized protein n=1 Tax=Gimesia fumaroli TaxID=2527976 RepID=A0A518I799_9PLAN|nr:hypothetical protein Enr17x_09860 [Gimesia fumaroli]